jgi:hypothetical protein
MRVYSFSGDTESVQRRLEDEAQMPANEQLDALGWDIYLLASARGNTSDDAFRLAMEGTSAPGIGAPRPARALPARARELTSMVDPNMQIALSLARGLTDKPPELPAALADVNSRAAFIIQIDKPLLVDGDGVPQWVDFGAQLRTIAELSADVMPELSSELDRISLALILWAGCITAAKTIAFETRSGANTVAGRTEAFLVIDRLAADDALFCAGV